MIRLIAFLLFPGLILLSSLSLHAEPQSVVTYDGREVILNEDGTWQFKSEDRFATTPDGLVVRLKEDGSWEYVGNTPKTTSTQVRTSALDVELINVIEEQVEKKVHKNVRVKSQMVFYVNVHASPMLNQKISLTKESTIHATVQDDTGKVYPVLSIVPVPATLSPDSTTNLQVRAEDAPGLFSNAKSMQLQFAPQMFNTQKPITLNYRVSFFEKKKVSGFDY